MSALWTSGDAAEATGGAVTRPWQADGVSIDTRSLAAGDLFVALKDARDGHDFVARALELGAAAALVSRIPEGVAEDAPLLIVDDVLAALEALAAFARRRLTGKLVAITGSVGKTTTKDMLRTILKPQMRVHAAEASYNNHWGVPLTLARMPPDAGAAVVEIGMSHPGEIEPLSRLARPHVALVTTVAPAHLEAFDDLDGIAREKGAIFSGLEPGGTAIFNADLPTSGILERAATDTGARLVSFGESEDADVRAEAISLHDETTVVRGTRSGAPLLFRVGATGRHYARNALAALAAAEAIGADVDRCVMTLANWSPSAGRGTRETIALDTVADHSIDLIDDAFNANPASMTAAVERLVAATPGPGGRRLAVLGDMLELGPREAEIHAALARHDGLDRIALFHCAGPRIRHFWEALPEDRRGLWTETAAEMAERVRGLLHPGDVVLVKGSKSAKTALVVDAIRKLGHRERRRAEGDV